MFETILTALIASAGANGIFVFIFQKWFETNLGHKNELALAEFKHKLELAATERNFRFTKTFDTTADVIAGTYKRLLELKDAVESHTEVMATTGDVELRRAENYKQKTQEFLNYFRPNKIYIPPDTAEKVWIFSVALRNLVFDTGILAAQQKAQVRDVTLLEKRYKRIDDAHEEIPKLLASLEKDFQKLLGF
jgi:hypothetical protein